MRLCLERWGLERWTLGWWAVGWGGVHSMILVAGRVATYANDVVLQRRVVWDLEWLQGFVGSVKGAVRWVRKD